MQIGDLVKWTPRGDHYEEVGIVTDVFSNGNYRVYWFKDKAFGDHYKETYQVEKI